MVNKIFLDKAISLLPDLNQTFVKVIDTSVFDKALNENDSLILDFGRHLTGHLFLRLGSIGSHADAPVKLKINFAERLQELDEDIDNYKGWICKSWIQEEQVYVDVIPGTLELKRRYAFRYVRIEVLAISGKFSLTFKEAYAVALSSANFNNLDPYKNNDGLLEKIDKVSCDTLRDCMQKVFEDGPKRDRRLWLGDLRLQSLANYYTFKNNNLVKACLYLFAALPMENDQIGSCLFLEPAPAVDDVKMFDYSLIYIPTLYDYYNNTNDIDTLQELWPIARKQIDIALLNIDKNNLVKDSDALGWCFIDWSLALNKQTSAQGVLMYCINYAIKIAKVLNLKDDLEYLENKFEDLKQASLKFLFDNEQNLFISGKNKQLSYASQIWMILAGTVDKEKGLNILKTIENCDNAIEIITPYLYSYYVMAKIYLGDKQGALEVIKDYWGAMVKLNADTFWELFNPKNPNESPYGGTIVNSYCHAWSTTPAYFLRRYFKNEKN